MTQTETKKDYNSTFTELKRWKISEKQDKVLSLITDNNTGKKSYLFNKHWIGADGKQNRGKGSTIPEEIALDVANAIIADKNTR